jgi:hypothetical protein
VTMWLEHGYFCALAMQARLGRSFILPNAAQMVLPNAAQMDTSIRRVSCGVEGMRSGLTDVLQGGSAAHQRDILDAICNNIAS